MKLDIGIKYTNGEEVTYHIGTPEWARWERKTGKSLYNATKEKLAEVGLGGLYQTADFLQLAYYAYLREAAGKPTKSYEIWELTVDEMDIFKDTEAPKVTPPEA